MPTEEDKIIIDKIDKQIKKEMKSFDTNIKSEMEKEIKSITNSKPLSGNRTDPVKIGLSPITWMRKYMGVK